MLLRLAIVPFLILLSLNCVPEPQPDEAADDADDVTPRWTVDPISVDITAEAPTPLVGAQLLQCFISDEHPATIDYHAGDIGDDDRKPITLVITSRGHEDRDGCFRELLLGKLGGEVLP